MKDSGCELLRKERTMPQYHPPLAEQGYYREVKVLDFRVEGVTKTSLLLVEDKMTFSTYNHRGFGDTMFLNEEEVKQRNSSKRTRFVRR